MNDEEQQESPWETENNSHLEKELIPSGSRPGIWTPESSLFEKLMDEVSGRLASRVIANVAVREVLWGVIDREEKG